MTEGMRYVMDALKNSQHNTWDEAAMHEIIHFLEKADTTVGTEEMIRRIYHLSSAWESQADERLTYREYVMPEDADESLDMLIRLYMDKGTGGRDKDQGRPSGKEQEMHDCSKTA